MSRDFRTYWSAEVTSTFGSVFTSTAFGVVAVRTFDASTAQIGVVSAAATVPAVIFGLLSGVVADRLGRPRRLLIACDGIAAAALATVAVGVWQGWASVWWLAALNLILGVLAILTEPVYFTHLRALVPPDQLVRGRARLQTGQYGAAVVGRSAAGPVIAIGGAAVGFVVDALSYLISMACLLTLRTPDLRGSSTTPPRPAGSTGSLLGEAADGIRELRRQPFLRRLAGFVVGWSCLLGGVTTLTAPFLLRVLNLPTGLYGVMFAFTGLAGLAGSMLGGHLVGRVSIPALTIAGFTGAIAATVLLPTATGPLPVAASLAVLGIALPVLCGAAANIGLTAVVTTDVPEYILGRFLAVVKTGTIGGQLVGALLGGVLGELIGIRPAMWVLSLAALASLPLLAVTVWTRRAVRPQTGADQGSLIRPARPDEPTVPASSVDRVHAG